MSARIQPVSTSSAPEAVRPQFEQLTKAIGAVPNLFATIGHSPAALQALMGWDATLGRSGLSRRVIEQLNLHVSELNGCAYCVSAHTGLSKSHGVSEQEILAARQGRGGDARETALLALARRVVRTGGGGAGTELVMAREAGVTDAQIIDALAVVALKVFTNAVALVARTELDLPAAPHLPTP